MNIDYTLILLAGLMNDTSSTSLYKLYTHGILNGVKTALIFNYIERC